MLTDRQIKRKARSIQERFEDFDAAHPEVYGYLVALVFEVKRKGFRHYGLRPLYERTRWHFQFERGEIDEDFKLNDHFISRYARKLIKEYPDLDSFFETRILKAG